MDLDNLNDVEVQELISNLKRPTRKFTLQEINSKLSVLFGSIDISENIIGVIDNIEYTLCIYRGKRDINRYSINLRFSNKYHQLIRIDIGAGHNNPDGTRIVGDHIHIYSDKYSKRDKFAYPLDVHQFPNVENIIDAFFKFTSYTHIEELV